MRKFNVTKKSIDFAGKEITIETGKMAKQANGSVFITCGETSLLVTATASSKPKEGQSFFPLTVDFEEKFYSTGKIPGGFFKREGRPSTAAILIARVIDRSIRPLFPDGYLNNVHVVIGVMSYDGKQDLGSLGLIGASAALGISDIPFNGPLGGISVGLNSNDEIILNLPKDEEYLSELELSVAATEESIVMIEGSAHEISEKLFLDAIYAGHAEIKKVCKSINELVDEIGKEKAEFIPHVIPEEIVNEVKDLYKKRIRTIFDISNKLERAEAVDSLKDEVKEKYTEKYLDDENAEEMVSEYTNAFSNLYKKTFREMIVNEKRRIDGRKLDEIRPLSVELDILARVHGSALFTRGETQSLGVVTLGTARDEQIIDGLGEEYKKDYYLHYNFPPYSVGEAGFMRGPGRREIGHGMLAESAIRTVLPHKEDFPYTIRIVSDILESNGSSSMATVCSGVLALMAAGVPIKRPVAGIANGLIKEGDEIAVLTDIQGLEDHLGDMDFKVTGTRKGITAMQMDIKIDGISRDVMEKGFQQAKEARLFIMDTFDEVITEPRKELSAFAPRIERISIKKDDIPVIIGKGGETIKKIIAETGVSIDIDEDNLECVIASPDKKAIDAGKDYVFALTRNPKRDEIYEGVVTRVEKYGAFVKFMKVKTGLVHVSKMANSHVKDPSDLVKVGDTVKVKFIGLNKGKVNLSMAGIKGNPTA